MIAGLASRSGRIGRRRGSPLAGIPFHTKTHPFASMAKLQALAGVVVVCKFRYWPRHRAPGGKKSAPNPAHGDRIIPTVEIPEGHRTL
jgi:hypothetical protein